MKKSKYYPLFWDWKQRRALFYRIYFNIFGIFFRIPYLPIKIDKVCFTFWRRGEEIDYVFKKHRIKNNNKRYFSVDCMGSFNTLKEIDNFWKEYWEYDRKICNNK